MWMRFFLFACCFGSFYAAPLHAAAIQVYNTGVDDNGNPVQDGFWDLHYLMTDPAGHPHVTYSYADPFPFGVWVADSAVSKWISPQASYAEYQSDPAGQYTYQTTFDLTGMYPDTANLTLRVAADDKVEIRLNGVTVWQSWLYYSQLLTNFSSYFTIGSGFQPGINTLDFVTTNNAGTFANPDGLRVEISGTAATIHNPEPGTVVLAAAGLLLCAVRVRRRA